MCHKCKGRVERGLPNSAQRSPLGHFKLETWVRVGFIEEVGVETICAILVTYWIRLSMLQCLSSKAAEAGTAKDGREFLHQTGFCNQTEFSPRLQNAWQRLPLVCSSPGINWQVASHGLSLPWSSLLGTISIKYDENDLWELNSASFTCCNESHPRAPRNVSAYICCWISISKHELNNPFLRVALSPSTPIHNPLATFPLTAAFYSHLSFNGLM